MKRSELTLLVGALALTLSFGACAHTYQIESATATESTWWGQTYDGPGKGGSCVPQTYGWWCGGTTFTPIYKKDPTTGLEVGYVDLSVKTSGFPELCWLGDAFDRPGRLGVTGHGYDYDGVQKSMGSILEQTGDIKPLYTTSVPADWAWYISTRINSEVPRYINCHGEYEVITAEVETNMSLRNNVLILPRIHRSTVRVKYKPVVPQLRVKLTPDTLRLVGTVGTYIVATTRVSVDSDVPVPVDVQWPGVDMVEYEIWEGKWADRKGDRIEVKDGHGYRDQKIRLISSTPLSSMISIPVKVTAL